MKKILSLALAVAMVLSLASVAFAADEKYAIEVIENEFYKIPTKKTYVDSASSSTASYGNTIYYPLWGAVYPKSGDNPIGFNTGDDYEDFLNPVTKYDAVKSVKISTDWNIGNEWVSKVDIVKKRWGVSGDYSYFLAITFKSAPTKSETSDVIGEIYLKKSSGDNKINRNNAYGSKIGETDVLAVDIELQYSYTGGSSTPDDTVIYDASRKYEFGDDYIPEDEEYEFTFDKWVDATFTVNTYGQGAIILKATTDYNGDIGALYPDANLDFYIGNGSSFNKTGEMFIPADEGSFIYEIKNGALVEIRGAEYDEYDEGFYFKTRTLGQYVVSDIELDVSASSAVTPGGDGGITVVDPSAPIVTVPTNPTTGAAA